MRRALALSGGLALVAALGACDGDDAATGTTTTPTPTPGAVEANAVVDWVVDGDTIDVVIDGVEERVRLTGIDTPEIAHESSGDRPGNDAECFADAAHEYARELIDVGTPVRLERDVVARDDYGRLLAYVYRASDGIFVNYELVRQGYATPLSIEPNTTYAELMVDAARDAERDDVGLWAACR